MELVYTEKRVVKPSAFGPPEKGYFAIDDNQETTTWDKCREQFAARFTETSRGFFICHNTNEGNRPASFLVKTEQVIGIADCSLKSNERLHNHSTFAETDRANILWVGPSLFWMTSEIKRQLLTIILRAGMNYDPYKNNYEEALWMPDQIGNNYAAKTKIAVTRFLYGFTEYISDANMSPIWGNFNNKIGWVSVFENKSEEAIRARLVAPEGDSHKPCVISIGKLWG